ncbi:DVU0524 family FlgM-associated protein [Desulfobacula sp.]
MHIPLHQIQNVMKLYSRQMSLNKIPDTDNLSDNNFAISSVHLAAVSKGRRQAIIDKVAANIVDKIITEKPDKKNNTESICSVKKKPEKKNNSPNNKKQFAYTVIDENNQRTTHTLPVEDSKLIVNRLMELAGKVSDY